MTTWTAPEVITALRTRFAPPEWYLVTEVANGTGYARDRHTYADAVAVNAFQSGKYGAEVHLFEVKVSRSDWAHELADPGKADAVGRYCDRRWLVVPYPADAIVRAGELPAGWGLLETSLGAVKTIAPAEQTKAEPMTRAFLAALVRRASEERAAKEEQKAALLRAPLRQVTYCDGYRGNLVLACGHGATYAPGTRRPKSVRCLACADGLPPAAAVADAAIKAMSVAELRALAQKATMRADALDANPWM
jgi:hypothetical protein